MIFRVFWSSNSPFLKGRDARKNRGGALKV